MSVFGWSNQWAPRVLLCGLALSSAACGPMFDPGSEVKTLRVLGVKKDKPYAQPGDTVHLELLAHDAKQREDIQYAFIGGCVNPPSDLFYGCFAQYGQAFAEGKLPEVSFEAEVDLEIPADVISSREGFEPGQPRYGLSIVFFAACAGQLSFDPNVSAEGSGGLPLLCLDEDGEPLGSDDFVVGYTSIYSFEGVSNQNPTFTVDEEGKGRFLLDGNEIVADCLGGECQAAPLVDVDCDAEPERCVEACDDDGDPDCPGIDVAPRIERIVERDDVSSDLFGTEVTEQMWVNYYVDRGGISEVKLLNDTNSGWNEKYRAELRAPKDKGSFRVWAVAHDNRGGMDFARVTLGVK